MSIQEQTKSKMTAAIDHLKNELKSIRTGRANPAMLDHVDGRGLWFANADQRLASVTAPEPRQLLITPFDPPPKGAIAKVN